MKFTMKTSFFQVYLVAKKDVTAVLRTTGMKDSIPSQTDDLGKIPVQVVMESCTVEKAL